MRAHRLLRLLLLCLPALVPLGARSAAAPQASLTLARGGRTDYVIVTGRSPIPAESLAAEELAAYLGRLSGATYRVLSEGETLPASKRLFVGHTRFARACGLNLRRLGEEEWVVRTVGSDLLISGGRPRGTLYGVYTLLEQGLGCHWLDESTEVVPTRPDLVLPALALQGQPAFWDRAISGGYYSLDSNMYGRDTNYRVRNRVNGAGSGNLDARHGFSTRWGPPGGCHTFAAYASEFPADHPEYLSMDARGKRVGAVDGSGPGGICLTHPEVRKLVLARLKSFIAADRERTAKSGLPPARIFDISQNDNHWMCQCPSCKALSEREGSESGPLIDFINEIADGIRDEYPGVYVMTFAYSITQVPPKTLRPRDNVIIRVAELNAEWGRDADLFHPLTYPTNAGQLRRLQGWSRIAPNLAEWDYWIQYSPNDKFATPYAPIACIPVDLRTFYRNRVKSIYVECESPETTSFYALKRWLGFQLMLDPLQAEEPLLRTFFGGYYGAAAPRMREYLQFMQQRTAAVPANMSGLKNYNRPYLTRDFYLTCERLLDEAEAACGTDKRALLHVRRERIPVDSGLFCMWENVVADQPLPLRRDSLLARYEAYRLEQLAAFRTPAGQAKGKEDLAREVQGMRDLLVIQQRRSEPPPRVRVPRTAAAGEQADPRHLPWDRAVVLAPWHKVGGGDTDRALKAWAMHDTRYLYLKLEDTCDTTKLVATDQVWSGDDWELFFAARREPPYRQLALGPREASAQYAWEKLIGQCQPADWQSGARIVSDLTPERWTAYLALPLATLVPGGVKPGAVCYANVARGVHSPTQQYLAWSPTFDDSFHVPGRFAEFTLE